MKMKNKKELLEKIESLEDELEMLKCNYKEAVSQCYTFTVKLRRANLIGEAFVNKWRNELRSIIVVAEAVEKEKKDATTNN